MNPRFDSFWLRHFPFRPSLNFASSATIDAGGAAPDAGSLGGGGGDPAPVDDAPPVVDTPSPDAPPAEPDLEAPPADDAAPADDEVAPQPTVEMEDDEPVTDEQLADAYRSHPELKGFLKQNPGMRATFFKAVEFNKIYRSVEDAKLAQSWAKELATFDKSFFSKGEANKREFLSQLWKGSLDEKGKSTGHYEELAGVMTSDTLTNLARSVAQDPSWAARAGITPEQARAAVHFTARMLGVGLKQGGASPAPAAGAAPRADGAAAPNEEFERERADFERQKSEWEGSQQQAFTDGIRSSFETRVSGDIDKRLAGSIEAIRKITPFLEGYVKSKISEAVYSDLKQDELLDAQIESLGRSGGRNPETRDKILAHLESRVRQAMPTAVRKVLQEAGITVVNSAKNKQARTDAAAGRREPSTAGGAPGRLQRPAAPSTKQKPGESYNDYAERILMGGDTAKK